uniref:Uncharacterized protein n=1 Tax=Acrobeloides nanus TaxID=290746 RepID=A0A914DZZ4_9BILA
MVNQAFQLTFSLLAFGKTVRKDEVERKIHEAKVEKLVLRAKLGIDDAIKVLERIQPDWLVDGVSTN